jgi:crotonobetainyl-CoA:carnitine CoA-transferase CaiB-like acyl-CoA transferase
MGIAHSHTSALYATYRCADDRWLIIVGELFIDQPWQRVCRALGLDDSVAMDARLQTQEGLLAHDAETFQILQNAIAALTRDEALKRFASEDVLAAPVNEYEEVFADPQVQHNGMIVETHHPDVGDIKLVGMPVRLSETPAALRLPPPSVGQDNERLLAELGLTQTEIAAMQDAGVIGSENRDRRPGEDLRW